MPKWVHDRAEHLLAKNPSMSKSMAFAVATQQGHATGHTPKGYGTAEGKQVAKAKFDTPKDDEKKANPGHLDSPKLKSAAVLLLAKLGFANSSYAGQPAQNGPGMKGRSQIPPFVAPPIETKEARSKALHRVGELVTGSRANKLYDAALQHAEVARSGNVPQAKASRKLRELAHLEEGKVGRTQGALATTAGLGAIADLTGMVDRVRERTKRAGVGVGAGMSTSQYSGPLSFGPFKQTSQIPGFVSPAMTKGDPGLEPNVKVGFAATGAMNAMGKLRSAQRVGAPKVTGFAGPSIAQIAKPKGFGQPLSGALKNRL